MTGRLIAQHSRCLAHTTSSWNRDEMCCKTHFTAFTSLFRFFRTVVRNVSVLSEPLLQKFKNIITFCNMRFVIILLRSGICVIKVPWWLSERTEKRSALMYLDQSVVFDCSLRLYCHINRTGWIVINSAFCHEIFVCVLWSLFLPLLSSGDSFRVLKPRAKAVATHTASLQRVSPSSSKNKVLYNESPRERHIA